jgi:hypothetical protein
MATVGRNHQSLANTEVPRLCFIGELQPSTAPEQKHPLQLGLLVPEAFRTGSGAGLDALKAQSRLLQQDLHLLAAQGRAITSKQIAITTGRVLVLAPAPTDRKPLLPGQFNHLKVAVAGTETLAQL